MRLEVLKVRSSTTWIPGIELRWSRLTKEPLSSESSWPQARPKRGPWAAEGSTVSWAPTNKHTHSPLSLLAAPHSDLLKAMDCKQGLEAERSLSALACFFLLNQGGFYHNSRNMPGTTREGWHWLSPELFADIMSLKVSWDLYVREETTVDQL